MSKAQPTIVFFAGAFADPSCFDALAEHLQKAGYPTVYAHVPSLNPSDASTVSTSTDAEVTRTKVLLPLIKDGRDVIVFTHSYGGVVGGAAAAGLSKTSRSAQGEPGGVIGLVYLVGNIVGEGETLLQAVGGAYPPFIKTNTPSQGLVVIDPVMPTLYNNNAGPAPVSNLEAAMIPHGLAAFETPATTPAWKEPDFDGRRVYIRTLDDQCNPFFLQEAWIEKSGVQWLTSDIKTSHCPFINCPEEVARVALGWIQHWS